ncbi:MAG: CBS domain-containing protein [Hyphomicrobiales bacterium]|nr:CBS domain-containing protein [Hyphomicrobiales bacterium]
MTVARILAIKGRDVVTARPHITLREAADVLVRHKIGAVVISDASGSVLGILSERDIVRAVSAAGGESLNDAVSKHMTSKVISTSEDESVEETMETMTQSRIRHLPVLRDGKLAGMISIGDVVKIRLEAIETEHKAMREYIANA